MSLSRSILRATLSVFVLAATATLASAGEGHNHIRHNDLMYNYYVGPAQCAGGQPAQLYMAPRPVPALVGHTYLTYQPLMPHEFLYGHKRTYSAKHPDKGWVRTRISYGTGPIIFGSRRLPVPPRPQSVNYHGQPSVKHW